MQIENISVKAHLTPWSTTLFKMLINDRLAEKFCAFYGTEGS
jgi:hypothetical protein